MAGINPADHGGLDACLGSPWILACGPWRMGVATDGLAAVTRPPPQEILIHPGGPGSGQVPTAPTC
jgi:hypothetical protein